MTARKYFFLFMLFIISKHPSFLNIKNFDLQLISRLRSLYEDSNDNIDGELNSGVYTVVVENYAWALKMQDPRILRFLSYLFTDSKLAEPY